MLAAAGFSRPTLCDAHRSRCTDKERPHEICPTVPAHRSDREQLGDDLTGCSWSRCYPGQIFLHPATTVRNAQGTLTVTTKGVEIPDVVHIDGSPSVIEFGDSLFADSGTASATATVHTVAQVGAMRVTLIGSAGSSQDSANILTRTSASWRDLITLAVPVSTGLGFSNIFVNGLLSVQGDMSIEGHGNVRLLIQDADDRENTLPPAPLASFFRFGWGFVQRAGNDIRILPPAFIPVRIGIFLGGFDPIRGLAFGSVSMGYEFTLDIDADAAGAVAATSRGDYGNTFSWGGITSVETSSGAPLTDYVLTSGSGFDYSQAAVVPEPSVMQLLLLGALVDAPLAFRRRLC